MGHTLTCTSVECKAIADQTCGCRDPDGTVEALFPCREPDGAADDVILEPRRSHASALPSGLRQSSTEAPHLRHLVLNVDINRTIIMTDSTGGKTMAMVVNETLAYAAWGENSQDGKSWILRSTKPSVIRPGMNCEDLRHHPSIEGRRLSMEGKRLSVDGKRGNGFLMSYSEWLEKQMPGSENRKKRQGFMSKFTEEGQPGELLRDYQLRALQMLKNPDGSDVRIIPAFFELLLWLKREKRSFSICFRTFGDDLGDVAEELTSFCEGRHPMFPGACLDGSDGEPDYRFSVHDIESCGTFHRDQKSLSLVMGTTEQAGEGKYRNEKDRSLEFFKLFPGVKIIQGWNAVQNFLWETTARCKTFGIRDYFQYWKSVGMTSCGGKLFFYRPSRYTQRHEIFFDDNIHYNDFFIVQPFNLSNERTNIFPTQLLNTHVCRAEPLESIFDKQYFIKHIVRLEQQYEQKLLVQEKMKRLIWQLGRQKLQDRMAIAKRGSGASRSVIYDDYDAWSKYRLYDTDLALDDDADDEAARAW